MQITDNYKIEIEVEDRPQNSVLLPEDKQKLVGFFALLLKIDRRVNDHLYNKYD